MKEDIKCEDGSEGSADVKSSWFCKPCNKLCSCEKTFLHHLNTGLHKAKAARATKAEVETIPTNPKTETTKPDIDPDLLPSSVKTESNEEKIDIKQEKDGEIQNTEQDDSPCSLDCYNSDLNLTINSSDCCSAEAMSSKASSNNINGHENIWLEIAQIL